MSRINIKIKGQAAVILITSLFLPLMSCSQKQYNPVFYVFPSRYSESAVQYFKTNKDNFVFTELLTPSNIESKPNSGIVDVKLLTDYVNRTFPDSAAEGVCIIDWEEPFRDIKKYYKNDSKYQPIAAEYIKAIRIIKSLRPNVKVGVYGIPFVAFSRRSEVLEANKNRRFDGILRECDLIAPAVYLRYSDQEVGQRRNLDYLIENLESAMEYGQRLDKPVLPFVWHRIHPMNEEHGLSILTKQQMEAYLNELFSATFPNGRKIGGVIWYESNLPHSLRVRQAELADELRLRDSIIMNYTDPFLKRIRANGGRR